MNLLKMKIKRKRMAVFLNDLRNGLSENKYLRKLRGLRRDSRCSMTDDTKIAIELAVRLHQASVLDRSVQALFASVGNQFGPSSISCRSGPTSSQKMSVLQLTMNLSTPYETIP